VTLEYWLLEFTRMTRLLLWLLVCLWLAGSAYRTVISRKERDPIYLRRDKLWTIWWFNSLAYLGYSGRWWFGLSSKAEEGLDTITHLGLNVLISMVAFAVLMARRNYEERRW